MRIALLSDVHANREALSACLAHAQACSVDRYIFLGDYVGYGADPGWAVDTVAAHIEAGAIAVVDVRVEPGYTAATTAAMQATAPKALSKSNRADLEAAPNL